MMHAATDTHDLGMFAQSSCSESVLPYSNSVSHKACQTLSDVSEPSDGQNTPGGLHSVSELLNISFTKPSKNLVGSKEAYGQRNSASRVYFDFVQDEEESESPRLGNSCFKRPFQIARIEHERRSKDNKILLL